MCLNEYKYNKTKLPNPKTYRHSKVVCIQCSEKGGFFTVKV